MDLAGSTFDVSYSSSKAYTIERVYRVTEKLNGEISPGKLTTFTGNQ